MGKALCHICTFLTRIEFGAAWKKTSKEQRDYVSFKLTLPGGTPVYLRLFENETTGDY